MVSKEDLFTFAEEKLKYLLFILNIKLRKSCNVYLGLIENVKEDGKKEIFVRAKGHKSVIKSSCHYSLKFKNEDGEIQILDPYKSSEDLKQYVKCIDKNKDVKTVLEYLKDKNESNLAFKFYKIIEIIGNDLDGKKNIPKQFNCISRNKFSDLTYTLNHGMGDKSRHHEELPIDSKILSEEEVEKLVKDIIEEWISKKCK